MRNYANASLGGRMRFERSYDLTLHDYVNFQNHVHRNRSRQNFWLQWHIYLPFLYIPFSLHYIDNNTIRWIGIVILGVMILFDVVSALFLRKKDKKYLEREYYKDFQPECVKITISENSIIKSTEKAEYKYSSNWVDKCETSGDYIFLMDDKNNPIILPKKHFSSEEQEEIIKYFGKSKL